MVFDSHKVRAKWPPHLPEAECPSGLVPEINTVSDVTYTTWPYIDGLDFDRIINSPFRNLILWHFITLFKISLYHLQIRSSKIKPILPVKQIPLTYRTFLVYGCIYRCIHMQVEPHAIWIMSEYVIPIFLFFFGCWPRWVDNFSFYRTVERTEEKRARYIYWREGNKKTKRGN